MNKKSQLYILTMVILLALTISFVLPTKTESPDKGFKKLYENYIFEAPRAANNDKLIDFTKRFVEYSHTIDSNFGVACISVDDNITVYNKIGKTITVDAIDLPDSQNITFAHQNQTAITLDSQIYYFNTSLKKDVKAVFLSESLLAKKIYIKE